MKYEMIFGDERLFDGAPEDAEYAGWFCQETRWYMILNGKILFSDGGTWCTSDNPYLSADIAAMRRIIKEPKRWTWEDKKAGVLPEVGAEYDVDGCIVEHLGNGAAGYQNVFYFKYPSGACGNAHERLAKPIETQAEKAQREEDEFLDYELSLVDFKEMSHPARLAFRAGARVAYRKLKGGE